MLDIAPEKIAHVIVRAREFDAKVAAWDDAPTSNDAQDEPESVLEDHNEDSIATELTAFIDALNEDEQVSLVALTWIGRGTYDATDLSEALEMARNERVNATSAYLLGIPLLADHLEDGLDKLGISVEDAKNDIL